MPIVNIYGKSDDMDCVRRDVNYTRTIVSQCLSVKEWPIDQDHISLRLLPVEGQLIGELEIVISAHQFDERLAQKDEVCRYLRSAFEKRWSKEVRVWLHLVEMGYGVVK